MSIASRITEMEQHITNAYDKIEDLGIDLTDVDKNIDNISSMLENVWDEYPKVTATDVEEATLENTKKGRINIDLKGQTEQEQLSGKNLFDKDGEIAYNNFADLTVLDTGIKATSNVSDKGGSYGSIKIPNGENLLGEALTLYCKATPNNNRVCRINVAFINSSGLFVSQIARLDLSGTGTVTNITRFNVPSEFPTNAVGIALLFYGSTTTTVQGEYVDYTDVRLYKGSYTVSDIPDYEPYCGGIPAPNPNYECPIKNVTGNANVKIQNKNLADISVIPNKSGNYTMVVANDVITLSANNNIAGYATSLKKLSEICPNLKVGDIATLSFKTTSSVPNKNNIYLTVADVLWQKGQSQTITQNMLDSIVSFYGGYNETAIISEFMIELGSTATDYVPHKEQNLPFTFAEGQRAMEGTTLQDDGIHQKRKQIIFDGSEIEWVLINTDKLRYPFRTPEIKDMKTTVQWTEYSKGIKSNAFVANNNSESDTLSSNIYSIRRGSGMKRCYMFCPKDFFTATTSNEIKSEWRAYLAEQYANGTPVIVEYELETEEIIPYKGVQQEQYNAIKKAQGYDDQTNITQTNEDLPFKLNIEALKK